jgi:hypothetical protein
MEIGTHITDLVLEGKASSRPSAPVKECGRGLPSPPSLALGRKPVRRPGVAGRLAQASGVKAPKRAMKAGAGERIIVIEGGLGMVARRSVPCNVTPQLPYTDVEDSSFGAARSSDRGLKGTPS